MPATHQNDKYQVASLTGYHYDFEYGGFLIRKGDDKEEEETALLFVSHLM